MSNTTILLLERVALAEQRRCIGLLLAEVGRRRLAGRADIADAIDAVITQIEHPAPVPETVGA